MSSGRNVPKQLAKLYGQTIVDQVVLLPRPRLAKRNNGAVWPSEVELARGGGFMVLKGSTQWQLRRQWTLPDTVGSNMAVLVCGLNPSPSSADGGVGFARPGNRFWPAALQAGLVSVDRDPQHCLTHHRVGMTDLVKRTTRTAAELTADEYVQGLGRLERLVRWLQPAVICFVGLAGWRVAKDRKAGAGWQPGNLAGRPVYLMPSTSGLNANSQLPDFVEHFHQLGKPPVRPPVDP